ncbi:efflux RND transporter periplasmic adaptor subunit [Rhizobium wuzhouense]|uniref:Efflux RND transporter periplasmic adaptor subunit n=1 Tax=Rhizobium wuzhouense TaxID=1986026 RepID=A0ABX5NS95_9HYPH|nr:efflux RND transporter periplasmic adaptor subunit [Rhizobium wuzhouense]
MMSFSMRRSAVIVSVSLLALGGGALSLDRLMAGSDLEPEFTQPVALGTIEETVLANGVLEPARMVNVGSQVSGQLKILHVQLGQSVRQGDIIAEIDSTAQSNALRSARAALANVRAQRAGRLVQLQQARQAYQRQRILINRSVTSTANLETADAAFKALEAEVEALEAQIVQATVEVENAESNLGYTRVQAPMDGVVVAVVAKPGQTLNAVQAVPTIVVLAQLDVMRVKVQISEADIGRVHQGQDLRFTIMGSPDKPIPAKLEQIEPAPSTLATDSSSQAGITGQPASQAVYYNGLFTTPNTDGRLRPSMTAAVTISSGKATDVPLMPWAALTNREADGRYRVKVRSSEGVISERHVRIGLTDRIHAQVLEGISAGEHVVLPADGELSSSADLVSM